MSLSSTNHFTPKKNSKSPASGNFTHNRMRRCHLYKCHCVWIKNIKSKIYLTKHHMHLIKRNTSFAFVALER